MNYFTTVLEAWLLRKKHLNVARLVSEPSLAELNSNLSFHLARARLIYHKWAWDCSKEPHFL
ncbi:hypothetical protein Hanom_Chr05g00415531 [Helianthus anomalus]